MFVIFLILAALVPIVLLIGLCTLVYWASADFADNQADLESANGNQSIFKRLFRWLNKPTERLDYRRDKLGRFRKVRRG